MATCRRCDGEGYRRSVVGGRYLCTNCRGLGKVWPPHRTKAPKIPARLIKKHAPWCKSGVTSTHDLHRWCLTCMGGVCPKCRPNAYADKSTPYVRNAE